MKHFVASILVLAALVTAMPASAALSLIWSDEFDGTSLDTSKWTIDLGNGCPDLCGWGNSELQYYRAENVEVTGGNLVLTAKEEYYAGSNFTSGKVHTRDKHSFLYGRIEMRAKLPTGGGMWPAFWMMPQDDVYGGWAASGEIDIMESSNETTTVGGALHYGGEWPDNTSTSASYTLGGANFADDFHIYAVEWDLDEIRWYVDGTHFGTKYSSQWYSTGAPENDQAPFDQAFYLILNLAVGGWYTGCTSTSCITADLPQEYLIDYVRVYQETPNQEPTVSITTPAPGVVPPAGDILIEATASDEDGTVDRVEFYDGTTFLGQDLNTPFTYTWTGVADGCYTVRAVAVDDGGAEGVDELDLTVGTGCGQDGYGGGPTTVPGILEAEDYDVGGEGVAYYDVTSENTGGQYRTAEGVDIETCSDTGGGYNVGWVATDEWLEFTVTAPSLATYPVDVRTSSLMDGGAFRIEVDGVDATGEVAVAVTGGWQTWTDVSTEIVMSAGTHVLRFVVVAEGFNLNRLEVLEATVDVVPGVEVLRPALLPCCPNPFNPSTTIRYDLPTPAHVRLTVFDAAGRRVRSLVDEYVGEAGRREVAWHGRDDAGRTMPAGVYFCRLFAGAAVETQRMVLIK